MQRACARAFWSRASSSGPPKAGLDGRIAWVIGGAGLMGTGLAHGLLRAGATVIINSRHEARLKALAVELGHPEKLVPLVGSMLPDQAENTVNQVMDITAGQLDHVVSHSAVRWWGAHREGDETQTLQTMNMGARGSLLDLSVEEFSLQAVSLPQLQFAAARLLVPRLQEVPNASYTFVTGGAGEEARSPMGQINAQAVWGLAAALRSEARHSSLRVSEVRVGMRFNRSVEERRSEPRANPLSHDVGTIAAGLAAAADHEGWQNALHSLDAQADVEGTKASFPVVDKAYAKYFSPEENLL